MPPETLPLSPAEPSSLANAPGLAGAAATGPAPPATGKGTFQDRFNQVYREKQEALRSLDALQAQNSTLESRLARLETRLEAAPTAVPADEGPITGNWERLSQAQLLSVIRDNPDQPEVFARAIDEISRRRSQAEAGKLREEWKQADAKKNEVNLYTELVKRDFGADALKRDSELTTLAQGYAGQFAKAYGADVLERQPILIHHVYALAHRDLMARRVSTLEEANVRLEAAEKTRLAQEAALTATAPPEHLARVDDLYKRGDRVGALREQARRLLSGPIPDR